MEERWSIWVSVMICIVLRWQCCRDVSRESSMCLTGTWSSPQREMWEWLSILCDGLTNLTKPLYNPRTLFISPQHDQLFSSPSLSSLLPTQVYCELDNLPKFHRLREIERDRTSLSQPWEIILFLSNENSEFGRSL